VALSSGELHSLDMALNIEANETSQAFFR